MDRKYTWRAAWGGAKGSAAAIVVLASGEAAEIVDGEAPPKV